MPSPVASAATNTNKRGERTKALLLEVAGRLLAHEPASAASLDRIAREAGVAKSSVLWHFGNKEPLYLAVVDRWFGDFEAQLFTGLELSAPLDEVLERFLAAYGGTGRARREHDPGRQSDGQRGAPSDEQPGRARHSHTLWQTQRA